MRKYSYNQLRSCEKVSIQPLWNVYIPSMTLFRKESSEESSGGLQYGNDAANNIAIDINQECRNHGCSICMGTALFILQVVHVYVASALQWIKNSLRRISIFVFNCLLCPLIYWNSTPSHDRLHSCLQHVAWQKSEICDINYRNTHSFLEP